MTNRFATRALGLVTGLTILLASAWMLVLAPTTEAASLINCFHYLDAFKATAMLGAGMLLAAALIAAVLANSAAARALAETLLLWVTGYALMVWVAAAPYATDDLGLAFGLAVISTPCVAALTGLRFLLRRQSTN